jgi:hypothetical protein
VIRIAISSAAFEAIAATLPLGSVAVELAAHEKGEREIWLDEAVLNKLRLLRGPGESYSDVILRLAAGDDPSLGKQLFTALRPLADRLVRPSLAPIYTERSGKPPEQSGTGFLVNHHDRPLLVTAKHCLFDGDPAFEKLIFFSGAPRPLKELRTGEIISDPNNDLAVLYVDELGLDRCLPMSCLVPGEITSGVISTFGFLVRDFKRDLAKGLFPAPWLFHYRLAPNRPGQGYVGILYHKGRNRRRDNRGTCAISDTEGCVGRPYARHYEAE